MAVEIYSTDTDSGQLTVIRKDGHADYRVVKEIPVGNAPRGSVKFTRDGRGFVSNTSANHISEIDALTHREVARITVGFGPRGLGIVPGERYLLASNSGSNTVSVVDLEAREEVCQVAVGRDPRHMAINKEGTVAYISVWGSGYIAKLDLTPLAEGRPDLVRESGRIVIGENTHPYSLNIDRTGGRALVACNSVAEIPVIDLSTDRVIARVPVEIDGMRAVAFTNDNEYALVTVERNSTVAVVDLRDYRVTRYIPVGPGPRGITIDDDDTFYISAFARPTTMLGDHEMEPHSVTVVHLDGVDLSTDDGDAQFEEVRVGYGPCSVSIFDTEKVSYDAQKLNEAAEELASTTVA
ncbi:MULTISPECIES: YncE family protein [unclassified Streptomyces]|uniref:YncE family protein n=1 Tax=unclassified Streptomyces TaxID=2593676 RepID=UPI003427663E